MPDDNDVQIKQNKSLLDAIRREQEVVPDARKQHGSGVGGGYAESGNNVDRQDERATVQGNRRTGAREKRSTQPGDSTEGVYTGIRPPDRKSEYTGQGAHDSSGRREKEPIDFNLKGVFSRKKSEPAKLFDEKEAEVEYDKLYEIYFYGSGILDDILEISVKGHEPVQIWQLDPDEAETLTRMHLQRATYDRKAAASARQLIALYDRLYFWLLAGPRAKATYSHVKEHGGFSFR